MGSDVIAAAIAEARRRAALSDRDLTAEVSHYERTVPIVCDLWRLRAVDWLTGGVNAPPLAVLRSDGVAGVLKVQLPGHLDDAARVLEAADGDGYVRMLAWDAGRGALLSERLGDTLWTAHHALGAQVRVIVPLLRRAWRVPLPPQAPNETKANGLAGILTELGPRHGTAAPRAVELASHYAERLAKTEVGEVVCHGDPHAGNVLKTGNGWALIDPDGFVGERAYDLGVVMRDACREFTRAQERRAGGGVALLHSGCRLLAELGAVDAERIWRWAFVERVTTGLYLHWFGHPDEGRSFLETAELIARDSKASEQV